MKRITKAKRAHLLKCVEAMQPWRIDTDEEAARLCDVVLRDLRASRAAMLCREVARLTGGMHVPDVEDVLAMFTMPVFRLPPSVIAPGLITGGGS